MDKRKRVGFVCLLLAVAMLVASVIAEKQNRNKQLALQAKVEQAFTIWHNALVVNSDTAAFLAKKEAVSAVLAEMSWKTGALFTIASNEQSYLYGISQEAALPDLVVAHDFLHSSGFKNDVGSLQLLKDNRRIIHYSRIFNYGEMCVHLGYDESLGTSIFWTVFFHYFAAFGLGIIILELGWHYFLLARVRKVFHKVGAKASLDNNHFADNTIMPEEAVVQQFMAEDPVVQHFSPDFSSVRVDADTLLDIGILVFEESGAIIQSNAKFNEFFAITESLNGALFTDVFCSKKNIPLRNQFALPDVFFENCLAHRPSPLLHLRDDNDEVEFHVTTLMLRENGRGVILVLVEKNEDQKEGLSDASAIALINQDLIQQNAQLRLENAEKSAVSYALRRAESRYRDIVDNAVEGIFQWTADGKLLAGNRAFAKMLGFQTVNSLMEYYASNPFQFARSASVNDLLVGDLELRDSVTSFEVEISHQFESPVWANLSARRIADANSKTLYYEAFVDNITNRKTAEEKLIHQAFHDPLTGLANRALFLDRLHMAIRRKTRHHKNCFAVLYLDLNKFKQVNDTYGHGVGDEVLCQTARTLLVCIRDIDTVARFGGDEFAVLLEDIDNPA